MMVVLRSLFSLTMGAVVAVALFFGMSRLVALGRIRLEDDQDRRRIEFTRIRKDSKKAQRQRKLPERPKPPPPPKTPPMKPSSDNRGGQAVAVDIPMPAASHQLQLQGRLTAGAVQDREAVPVVRVNPEYPASARRRGIEGFVTVRFTIGPSGRVTDATVIDSKPPGVFDRSVLKAIRRWRYDPKLVDGKPVARPNQRVTLKFELGT